MEIQTFDKIDSWHPTEDALDLPIVRNTGHSIHLARTLFVGRPTFGIALWWIRWFATRDCPWLPRCTPLA
jgi:hypothetical protein